MSGGLPARFPNVRLSKSFKFDANNFSANNGFAAIEKRLANVPLDDDCAAADVLPVACEPVDDADEPHEDVDEAEDNCGSNVSNDSLLLLS